jgi:hypothetical protein
VVIAAVLVTPTAQRSRRHRRPRWLSRIGAGSASHLATRTALAAALLAAASAACLGCSREPSSDVVAEPTPSVPTDVVFYTHVLYGGDDAYLIDGQWFRPAATGWVVFTKEPLELALIRRTLEQGHRRSWFGVD